MIQLTMPAGAELISTLYLHQFYKYIRVCVYRRGISYVYVLNKKREKTESTYAIDWKESWRGARDPPLHSSKQTRVEYTHTDTCNAKWRAEEKKIYNILEIYIQLKASHYVERTDLIDKLRVLHHFCWNSRLQPDGVAVYTWEDKTATAPTGQSWGSL